MLVYFREHYGDLASVVGLFVSLVGFLVTILGVKKAEKAAEGARQAAREVVGRVKSQLLLNEIEASIRYFREIDRARRGRRWEEAADRCDDARACLARVLPDDRLFQVERESIEQAVEFLGGFLPYVQKLRNSGHAKDIASPKSKDLHDAIIAMGSICGRLRTKTLEL